MNFQIFAVDDLLRDMSNINLSEYKVEHVLPGNLPAGLPTTQKLKTDLEKDLRGENE